MNRKRSSRWLPCEFQRAGRRSKIDQDQATVSNLAIEICRRLDSREAGAMSTTAIPGTTIFGPVEAQRGYALNKMCFSFNAAENRARFLQDEEAYMRAYALDE